MTTQSPHTGSPAATAPTQGAYAQINGMSMYYESHGEGRPLVLLHGGVQTIGLSFGVMIPTLAATRRVIGVELQGHGHTGDIDREMTVPAFAGDVVALLDELGIERADLFGFSLGGSTALEIAVRYPERVDRLILASVRFQLDGYFDEIQDPALWAGSKRLPTEADFQEMAAAYTAVAPDPARFQDLPTRCGVAANYEGWSEDELCGLAGPVLLVIGDTDFVRIEHAAKMLRLIPDARLAVLPDCTHTDVVRRTGLVLPMVETFLAE